MFVDSQTNNTQDGPFLHKYASPFWPQKLSKTVSIKGEGFLLAPHPSLFSNITPQPFYQPRRVGAIKLCGAPPSA
jgi:hypothetical protein